MRYYKDLTLVPNSVGYQIARHLNRMSAIQDVGDLKEYIKENVFVDSIVGYGTGALKMAEYRMILLEKGTIYEVMDFINRIYWKAKRFYKEK